MKGEIPNTPLLLNLGCGPKQHPAWVNVDYDRWNDVKQSWPFRSFLREKPARHYLNHDLRKGIPFHESCADAVYAAQFLEHLDRPLVHPFLNEVRRVLKPGAVLRLVVPDLEFVCDYYLKAVAAVRAGDPVGMERHEWATLWLLDQMVRTMRGGELGAWMESHSGSPFLRELGGESASVLVEHKTAGSTSHPAPPTLGLRNRFAQWIRARYEPRTAAETGELHRWMYDAISLRAVLEEAGFHGVVQCTHDESRIPGWGDYGFDAMADGTPAQPGSIWMEAVK